MVIIKHHRKLVQQYILICMLAMKKQRLKNENTIQKTVHFIRLL